MTATSSIEGIAIAGATASGKSALALQIACALDGLIVNADSAQVYADLRVLTARPSPEDEKLSPHALYGHVDGKISYSAADWARAAKEVIEKNSKKLFPILVGGSGLYFRALFEGLADLPPISAAIREKWRTRTKETSAAHLHAELVQRDPATAQRLKSTDKQRIVRALEVIESTGRPLQQIQAQATRPLLDPSKWLRIVLKTDSATLQTRIEQRFKNMLEHGAIEEVKALLARKLDPAQPVMKAIGAPELAAYLAGNISLEEASEKAIIATRQYAKRQETWFRNQMKDWQRLSAAEVKNLVAGLKAA